MKPNTIIELDSRKAREYLLLPSSYCTVNLPEYYDFSKILKFVKQVVGRKDIHTCLADKKRVNSLKLSISLNSLLLSMMSIS